MMNTNALWTIKNCILILKMNNKCVVGSSRSYTFFFQSLIYQKYIFRKQYLAAFF